jgi:hypothetical protein
MEADLDSYSESIQAPSHTELNRILSSEGVKKINSSDLLKNEQQ